MDAESRSTLIAGLSFDVAQWEIWSPLTSGGTLYLPPEDARLQPEVLLAYFAEQGITHASLPAVLVADVVGAPQPANLALRYLFSSGEKLHPVDLRGIDYPLIDYYGPTEATIFVTCNQVACATQNPPASIGRPIGDTEIFILDDRLQPVIGDRPGELYISGRCLARGYLNNPALTAERFITRLTSPGYVCIAAAIGLVGWRMAAFNIWAVSTIRSKSAAIALNWAKSKTPCCRLRAFVKRWPPWRWQMIRWARKSWRF